MSGGRGFRGVPAILVEAGIEAAKRVVIGCLELGLDCRDVPAVTSRLLYDIGCYQYRVRRFWSLARKLTPVEATLYRWGSLRFVLRVVHVIGPLHEVVYNGVHLPVDEDELGKVEREGFEIEFAPKSHQLFVHLEGVHGERVILNLNVVRLLVLAALSSSRGVVREFLDCIKEAAWGRVECLLPQALRLVSRWRGVLSFILPHTPRGEEDLERVSPLLRHLRIRRRP